MVYLPLQLPNVTISQLYYACKRFYYYSMQTEIIENKNIYYNKKYLFEKQNTHIVLIYNIEDCFLLLGLCRFALRSIFFIQQGAFNTYFLQFFY